jgi:CheY-like chemotaxis protein
LLELIAKTLDKEGYDVTTVTTAEEAMAKARSLMPDLILIDIILPDMEGPEAVRALRKDSLTEKIPVLFLSGIVTRPEEGKAFSEVVVGERKYRALSKPFSAKELIAEMNKIIG